MEKAPFALSFGMTARKVSEQVKGRADVETLKHFDKDADCLTRLRFRKIITEREYDSALDRLSKQIFKAIES